MKKRQDNLNYEKIVSIKKTGKQPTYDFTIPKTHCYFANKILVHNSGSIEQLSTICLIIYKIIEKHMGIQTEKIMLKIAKNRHGACGEKEITFEGKYFKFSEITYEDRLYAEN